MSKHRDCGECTSARSQSDRCIQSKSKWLMFIHWKFVYKPENFPKFPSFFFFKNTPKYDKLSKISNISINTMLELRTKLGNFGNFGNFGHISDGLWKEYSVRTQCCNLIGSELVHSLYCRRWYSSVLREKTSLFVLEVLVKTLSHATSLSLIFYWNFSKSLIVQNEEQLDLHDWPHCESGHNWP